MHLSGGSERTRGLRQDLTLVTRLTDPVPPQLAAAVETRTIARNSGLPRLTKGKKTIGSQLRLFEEKLSDNHARNIKSFCNTAAATTNTFKDRVPNILVTSVVNF